MPKDTATNHLFASGHTACSGCGQSLGARLVMRAAGRNIIATDATGCLEVFSSLYPFSAWEVPWVHSLFENSAAVASGVEAALKDSNIDAVVPILLLTDDTGVPPLDFIVELARKYPEKPIYVTFTGEKKHMDAGKVFLEPRGVPTYPLIEDPFEVLALLARCRKAMERP